MELDPHKHPHSAALYNKPYKGKHRRKSGCPLFALFILGLFSSAGAVIVDWLS